MIRKLKLLLAISLSVGFLSLAAAPGASAFSLFPSNDKCDDYAQNSRDGERPTVCKDSRSNDNPIYGPEGIVRLIVNILATIIGVAAIIVIIVAGIQYMLSTGDPTKVNNAKNAILYALAGLAIAVAARTVVVYILSKL